MRVVSISKVLRFHSGGFFRKNKFRCVTKMTSSVREDENCLVSTWSCKPQISWKPVLSSFKYSTAEAVILNFGFSLIRFENLVFHQGSSSPFWWLGFTTVYNIFCLFLLCWKACWTRKNCRWAAKISGAKGWTNQWNAKKNRGV